MRLHILWFAAAAAAAPLPQQQFIGLGDFRLESGQVIRDCRIGYRTFGTLNAARSNAVLFPTWFTGTSKDLAENIGPGKLVDPARWYVIAVDALGDGVSTSPSNSGLQPRMKFPAFTIRDMVNSQRQLLEKLKISHLHAVVGISMGGMQTFEWIVAYPGFMDYAVPVVGSPQLTAYDLLLWDTERRAIEEDPAWKGGEYAAPPAAAMRAVAGIHTLALTTPQHRNRETPRANFPAFLIQTQKETLAGFDANNWIRQLEAMMNHDVGKSFGGDVARAAAAVRARVLVVVGLADHMVNPQPALAFARRIGAATLELDSDCGHLAFDCEAPKAAPRVARFLEGR